MEQKIRELIEPILNNRYRLEYSFKDNTYTLKLTYNTKSDEIDVFKRYTIHNGIKIAFEIYYLNMPSSDILNKIFKIYSNAIINASSTNDN